MLENLHLPINLQESVIFTDFCRILRNMVNEGRIEAIQPSKDALNVGNLPSVPWH